MYLDSKWIAICLKPEKFGKVVSWVLHRFWDSCENGYGQSSYIRLLNKSGQVYFTLPIEKSRVAAINFVSIQKLELTVASLSVKNSKMLKNELEIHVDDKSFWADILDKQKGYIDDDVR